MGKANSDYFPERTANAAEVGNSIVDEYRNKEPEIQEETEEPEKCPGCGNKVPEMEQLYNKELDAYLHVGCFQEEVETP